MQEFKGDTPAAAMEEIASYVKQTQRMLLAEFGRDFRNDKTLKSTLAVGPAGMRVVRTAFERLMPMVTEPLDIYGVTIVPDPTLTNRQIDFRLVLRSGYA